MYSVKTKLCTLGLAAAMLLGLAGCAFSTPATVGSIGGVEIPAGVYLLAQYNSYTTASNAAELATGESASDVKAVLKATCTGTIGDEEVTATGSEYVEKLTLRALEYYAEVELLFDELGGELDDAATSEVADTADSLWETNGDLYEANGIGKTSLQTYLTNSEKATELLEMLYGEDGQTPVSEDEYTDYINNECYYIEGVQIPLVDYSTYTLATDDQKTVIEGVAETCAEELNETATGETAQSDAIYTAAMTYVPTAMSALGSEIDATTAVYYAFSQLCTPDDLTSYDSGDANELTDPLDEVELGEWVTIDMGTTILVVHRIDPFTTYTTADLVEEYDLLTALKKDEFQSELYADGAALEHALDSSAVKIYSASKIKKTV